MNILTFITTYYEYYLVLCVVMSIGAVNNELDNHSESQSGVIWAYIFIVFITAFILWPIAIAERIWKWID